MSSMFKAKTNGELLQLYQEYDDLIHGKNPCYGVKDVKVFHEICREMDRREE